MSLPIEWDPFHLKSFGLSQDDLPDRNALEVTESPRLSHGGFLPHAGVRNLWELPAAVGRHAGSRDRLWLRLSGESKSQAIERKTELPLPSESKRASGIGGTTIGGEYSPEIDAENLHYAVRSYGDALHRIFDRARDDTAVIETAEAVWCPSRVVIEEMQDEINKETSPPIETIIKVQQRLEQPLQELRGSLRRILRRRRRMVPIALAETVDAGCVQWLAKQPGRTLEERAGSRQEILAVVREESVDTFENRVLKKCLQLCAEEARRYTRIHGARFPGNERVAAVDRFRRQALEMLQLEEFDQIGELSDDSRPNYVLQYAPRYRDIWWAYQLLKQRRRAEDDLWKWRHRIWSEILLIDLAIAASELAGADVSRPDRELGLLRDPQRGFWLHAASRLPIFPVHREERVVHVSLSAPMHAAQATEPVDSVPCDILITIGCRSDDPEPFQAMIVGCASFLPLASVQDDSPVRLVLRPQRSYARESKPLEVLRETPGGSRILPWPIYGPTRIECARTLILALINRAGGQ